MNLTETRPRSEYGAARPTAYAVRAQHDGASHYLVREAGQRSVDLGGRIVNEPEVFALGIHTASCCEPTGDVSYPWRGGCAETAPPDELQILRYGSREQAQGAADRANANPAGFVWYVIEHEWNPPAGYQAPINADSLAELEQRNTALRMQLAQAEHDALQAQLTAARPELAERTQPAAPFDAPPPFGSPPA